MRVRGGRVARKNNWVPDVKDYYARPQSEIQIERSDPGPGPDWDELAMGLEAISIWRGNPEWVGLSNPGVVVITAWPREMWWRVQPSWIEQEAELLARLEVRVAPDHGSSHVNVHWTPAQARAYMLTDVLVH
jgi:hypothetical protein